MCRPDNLVEITAGLKAGEKVASAANFLIDSEAKLKGVEPLPQAEQREPGTDCDKPRSQVDRRSGTEALIT